MIYLYITLVVMFFAVILWGIMCCHYVLQRQRHLNAQWEYFSNLLHQRNALMGEAQNLWVAPGMPAPDTTVQHLQDLLAEDTAMDWQNVQGRAALRPRIESMAQQMLAAAHQHERIAKNPVLSEIEQMLNNNAALMEKSIKNYNRSVQIYNAMLHQFPHDMLARKIGLEPAPVYRIL